MASASAKYKATQILALGPSIRLQDFPTRLGQGLQRHVTMLHGPGGTRHNIDQVIHHPDPDGAVYEGFGQGTRRLLLMLSIDPAALECMIILIATRGTLRAEESLFGQQGPDIGNALLVARLYHVALAYARAAGLEALTNDPYDARLALKYTIMGFIGGTRLPLGNAAQLAKALTYVEDVYANVTPAPPTAMSLSLPPPPL
jgi:hypothetical protein